MVLHPTVSVPGPAGPAGLVGLAGHVGLVDLAAVGHPEVWEQ